MSSTGTDDLAELLTIAEVAERLRVSVMTVRWLRQEGRFRSCDQGRSAADVGHPRRRSVAEVAA